MKEEDFPLMEPASCVVGFESWKKWLSRYLPYGKLLILRFSEYGTALHLPDHD